jgi:hypothetical protein
VVGHDPQQPYLDAEAVWLRVLLTIFGLLGLAALTFWLLTR